MVAAGNDVGADIGQVAVDIDLKKIVNRKSRSILFLKILKNFNISKDTSPTKLNLNYRTNCFLLPGAGPCGGYPCGACAFEYGGTGGGGKFCGV